MEAFSLLKFWKSSSISVSGGLVSPLPAGTNTILATVEDETEDSSPAGDDGSFFDLEFAGADSDEEEEEEQDDNEKPVAELVEVLEESETEDGRSDPNLPVATSDDLFNLLAGESGSDDKPRVFPVSLLRSATKLRILMSGLKKSSKAQADPNQPQQRKKLFTIKFKSGEVPIVSLFNRDHSSRPVNGVVSSFSSSSSTSSTSSSSSSASIKPSGESQRDSQPPVLVSDDNKRNSKDGVQKYFKMVKPLYIRVSKRYGEKLGFTDEKSTPVDEEESGKESEKKMQGSLGVGLKVMMRKKLSGKNKSPESGVVPPAVSPSTGRQRDDSLIQQQEWIQGAILHCKRSFNSSREDDESGSVTARLASDPIHEKEVNDCTHEQNDVVVGGR